MFVPTGETPLDILLRIANIVVIACQGLIEFFSTPVLQTMAMTEQVPIVRELWYVLEALIITVLGYDVTWIEFIFISIPIILVYNLIKWVVGIVTGS